MENFKCFLLKQICFQFFLDMPVKCYLSNTQSKTFELKLTKLNIYTLIVELKQYNKIDMTYHNQ